MSQHDTRTEASENDEKIKILREASQTLQYIATKQSNMEQRQCNLEAEGTDASRMAEQWTRGENGNLSAQTINSIRETMIAHNSYMGTSYSSIFQDKDYIRSEKLVYLFFEQLEWEVQSGPRDSSENEDVGKSLSFLPIFEQKWRGDRSRSSRVASAS